MAVKTTDLHWSAGFLDGEGSFTFSEGNLKPRVCCGQDREPLEKLQAIFGGKIYYSAAKSRTNPIFYWQVGGAHAISVMMTLWVLLSARRKIQVEYVIGKWKASSSKMGPYIKQFLLGSGRAGRAHV